MCDAVPSTQASAGDDTRVHEYRDWSRQDTERSRRVRPVQPEITRVTVSHLTVHEYSLDLS